MNDKHKQIIGVVSAACAIVLGCAVIFIRVNSSEPIPAPIAVAVREPVIPVPPPARCDSAGTCARYASTTADARSDSGS